MFGNIINLSATLNVIPRGPKKDEPHVRDSINLSLGNGYTIKRMLLRRTTPLRLVLRDEDDDPNRFD